MGRVGLFSVERLLGDALRIGGRHRGGSGPACVLQPEGFEKPLCVDFLNCLSTHLLDDQAEKDGVRIAVMPTGSRRKVWRMPDTNFHQFTRRPSSLKVTEGLGYPSVVFRIAEQSA